MLKLSFISDPKLLCVVRAAVGEMAVTVGFGEAEVRSVVLAVDEALANVIRHAYHGSFDRPIQIAFYRGQIKGKEGMREALKIQIVDRGIPGRPRTISGARARRYTTRWFRASLHP